MFLATSTFLGMHATWISLSNHTRYPTTISLFAMPAEFFSFTLGHLARNLSWTELNVVYKTGESNFYMINQKLNFLTWLKYDRLRVEFIAAPGNAADVGGALEFGAAWARVVQKRGMSSKIFWNYLTAKKPFCLAVTVILLDNATMRRFMVN